MYTPPIYFTCSLLVAVLIIVLNSYVISLFKRKRNLRSHSNYLLLSLTISDLFTGVVVIPYTVAVGMVNHSSTPNYVGLFIFSDIFVVFSAAVTMLNLSAIIIDRHMLLCHPLAYSNVQTKAKFVKAIVLLWLIAIFCSFIPLAWLAPVLTSKPARKDIIANAYKNDRLYSIIGFGLYCLVCLALFLAFVRMFWSIRRFQSDQRKYFVSRKERNSLKSEWKALLLFSVMFVIFLLCWSPMVIIRFLDQIGLLPSTPPRFLLEILVLFRFLSSLLNPILYTFYKLDFQTAMKEDKRNVSSFVSTAYHSRNLKLKHATNLHSKDCNQTSEQSFHEKTNPIHHIDGNTIPSYYTPYKSVAEQKVVSFINTYSPKNRNCNDEPLMNGVDTMTSRPLTSTPERSSNQAKEARMVLNHDVQSIVSPTHGPNCEGDVDVDSIELSMIYVPPKGLGEETMPFCSSYDLVNSRSGSVRENNEKEMTSISRPFSMYDNVDSTDVESM